MRGGVAQAQHDTSHFAPRARRRGFTPPGPQSLFQALPEQVHELPRQSRQRAPLQRLRLHAALAHFRIAEWHGGQTQRVELAADGQVAGQATISLPASMGRKAAE